MVSNGHTTSLAPPATMLNRRDGAIRDQDPIELLESGEDEKLLKERESDQIPSELTLRDKKALTLLVALCQSPLAILQQFQADSGSFDRPAPRNSRRTRFRIDPIPPQSEAILLPDRHIHPLHLSLLSQATLEPHRRLLLLHQSRS